MDNEAKMLEDLTYEQLRAEVQRREKVMREEAIPKQLEAPDLAPLRSVCQRYIDQLSERDDVDTDLRLRIFRTAITTLFGNGVWEWVYGGRQR